MIGPDGLLLRLLLLGITAVTLRLLVWQWRHDPRFRPDFDEGAMRCVVCSAVVSLAALRAWGSCLPCHAEAIARRAARVRRAS